MAFQLLHWCLTRRSETEKEKTDRLMNKDLEEDSEFLNEEANQIFTRMKMYPDQKVGLLHHYKIGDEAMGDIFKHFGRNTIVLQLNLSHNIISDDGAGHCAEAMKQNSTLQVLDLSYNNIGNHGARFLADSLKQNTTLTTLQLNQNEFDDEGGGYLATAMKNNGSISSLCLSDTFVGDECMIGLAEALQENKSLTRLDFYNTRISDVGAMALAKCLERNKTLEILNLSGNEITDAGGVALVATLAGNEHLKCLEMYRNKITEKTVSALSDALSSNTSLTQLNIGCNSVAKETLDSFNAKISSYKKREVCTSGLKYINTYQCIDWGKLDKGAEEKYERWLAAMKDKGGLPVEIPCPSCSKTLKKHKKSPWPAWNCVGEDCGEQFTQTEPCYTCTTPMECKVPLCVGCYDKIAAETRKKLQEIISIACHRCNTALVQPTDDGPSPEYSCHVCSLTFDGSSERGYRCETPETCKFFICPDCYNTRGAQLREIKKEGVEMPCKKCKEGVHLLPTTPFKTWDCDTCKAHFTKTDHCYGCITVRECDLCFCEVCWVAGNIKILENRKGAVSVPCKSCKEKMGKIPTTPFPAWGCDMCGESYTQNDEIYGCATLEKCDFCYCAKCFSKVEDSMRAELKDRVPVPCGKCREEAARYNPTPFEAWGCDICGATKTQADPCFGCPTMAKCDYCLCSQCYTGVRDKMFSAISKGSYPCHGCNHAMAKHPTCPFPAWGCDGCGSNYTSADPVYGCPTVSECDFCFCETCFERAKKSAARMLHPPPAPNACKKCSQPLSRLDPNPFPEWGCDGCGTVHTAEQPAFGCPTVQACDFCFCQTCYEKAEKEAAAKSSPPPPTACKKCATAMSQLDPCPFPEWGCDGCGTNFTAEHPVFGCPTVTTCDYCFCGGCYQKAEQAVKQREAAQQAASCPPNACRKCTNALSQLDPCPFPEWGCDGCGKNFTAEHPVFGCPTVATCDFCFCEGCFAKATEMAKRQEEQAQKQEQAQAEKAEGASSAEAGAEAERTKGASDTEAAQQEMPGARGTPDEEEKSPMKEAPVTETNHDTHEGDMEAVREGTRTTGPDALATTGEEKEGEGGMQEDVETEEDDTREGDAKCIIKAEQSEAPDALEATGEEKKEEGDMEEAHKETADTKCIEAEESEAPDALETTGEEKKEEGAMEEVHEQTPDTKCIEAEESEVPDALETTGEEKREEEGDMEEAQANDTREGDMEATQVEQAENTAPDAPQARDGEKKEEKSTQEKEESFKKTEGSDQLAWSGSEASDPP